MSNHLDILESALHGKNITRIAQKSGVHQVTINRWLRENGSPNLLLFSAVINACGYELKYKLDKLK